MWERLGVSGGGALRVGRFCILFAKHLNFRNILIKLVRLKRGMEIAFSAKTRLNLLRKYKLCTLG